MGFGENEEENRNSMIHTLILRADALLYLVFPCLAAASCPANQGLFRSDE